MRLDAVGPKAFRAAFEPTNLGRLFASEAGERLWRPLLAPLERFWQQWDGRADGFAAARSRVLDYGGRIRVLWLVEPGEERGRVRVSGVFAMDTDGTTDLSALADDLARVLVAWIPAEPTERNVGEHALRVLGRTGSDLVTIPLVIDGCVVAFFGEARTLDRSVPRCLRALADDDRPAPAPLALHVDLTQLGRLTDEPVVSRLFGLESLRSFDASVRPSGPYAELELEVAFADGERGILAGFLPAVDALPTLLHRVPSTATPWLVLPFRPDLIFRAGLEAAASRRSGGVDAVRQEMRDELGLDPDSELLGHFGGELMVLGDLWQADDSAKFRGGGDPPLGACIAWSLRDTAAFGRGFDRLLDYLKGHVHRYETRAVDGVQITRLGSLLVTGVHVGVGQDLFALGFGAEGVAQLEALVAAGRDAAQRPLPTAVRRVQHRAPPGWNGVGAADLTAVLGGQITLLLELLDDALPPAMRPDASTETTQEWLDRLAPLIAEHRLDHLVTMTGHDGRSWRLRLVW
jgi:hypothetical protein